MKQNEANKLAVNLISKFGLALKATVSESNDDPVIYLQPEDIESSEGFQVKITIGWRSLYFDIIMGKFAADLLQQFANSSKQSKFNFTNLCQHIIAERGEINFKINESIADPLHPEHWPVNWKQLTFSLRRSSLDINSEDHSRTEQLINNWSEKFLGCIIALAPLEEIETNIDIEGFPEGALTRVPVNRYERSQYNRTLCLNFHGTKCKVCEFDFSKVYGVLGTGFIHVHHIKLVSEIGPNYLINPIQDLIPVCPNCHSMLHKKAPPYTVNELKALILSFKKTE